MPDFDVDFCQDRRGETIEYVRHKYGLGSVAQIITFGKLQAKAVIRDVGRVLQMNYSAVDRLSKLVPNTIGITLNEAFELEPEFKKQRLADPQVDLLMTSRKAGRPYATLPPTRPASSSGKGRLIRSCRFTAIRLRTCR